MKTFAISLIIAVAAASGVRASTPVALGPSDSVENVSMPTWTILWWHWAFSMDQRLSPIRDRTGERCALNQSGPVWYLTGGFGVDSVIRYCTVPANRHLFFPVVNLLIAPSENEPITCAEAQKKASFDRVDFLNFWVRVNDVDMRDAVMLVSSPDCFDVMARMPKIYKAPMVFPAATSGFWVMMEPLPEGKHVIQFGAQDTRGGKPNDGIIQAVVYVLTVEAE